MIASLARSPRYPWYAFAAMAIGTFASVVDHGSVGVALPTIAGHFHTDIPSVQWLVIGFAMTIIALLLPMGRLADLIGAKRVYVIGCLVFVLGSLFAGAARDLSVLILARIVQGTGAAMTQGTGMAIVIGAFPPTERGKAIGLIMTMVGTGAVAGPVAGGFLVDAFGWRAVFLATVPLVLASAAWSLLAVEDREARRRPGAARFDWPGAALAAGALLALLLGVTNGHRAGWTSPAILAAGGGFAALLAAFIRWELRCGSPMLELRLFRRRNFAQGTAANFSDFYGQLGGAVYDALLPAKCAGLPSVGGGAGRGAGGAVHGAAGAAERAAVGSFRLADFHYRGADVVCRRHSDTFAAVG